MNWLVLYFGLQMGLWSGGVDAVRAVPTLGSGQWISPDNTIEISTDVRLAFLDGHFEITGVIRSYQTQAGPVWFYPFRMDYGIGANLKLGAVTLRVEHECDHGWGRLPFLADGGFDQLAMWHTEFSVRFEGSAHLF